MEILECVVFFWVLSVLTGSLLGCTHAELCLPVLCSSWYLCSDLGALSYCFFRHVFWVFSTSDYFCDQPKFGADFHIDIWAHPLCDSHEFKFLSYFSGSFILSFLPTNTLCQGASTFLPLENWEGWVAHWVRKSQHHSTFGSSSSLWSISSSPVLISIWLFCSVFKWLFLLILSSFYRYYLCKKSPVIMWPSWSWFNSVSSC